MGKDPAFLFYHHDFLVGTAFMTMADRGAYITILCYMAAKGPLSLEQIRQIVPNSEPIMEKFKQNEKGLWFNERLLEEVDKRRAYCESRRINKSYDKTHVNVSQGHMVNENDNNNNTLKALKTVIKKHLQYSDAFNSIWTSYPLPVGKKDAYRHYVATVTTEKDHIDIWTALNNYKASKRVAEGFIQDGKTWFNNWRDWVEIKVGEGEEWKTKSNLIRR